MIQFIQLNLMTHCGFFFYYCKLNEMKSGEKLK